MKFRFFFVLFSLGLFSSCGNLVQNMAVGTTASILSKASVEMQTDGNFENVSKAMMANLKTIDALLYLRPHDQELLVTLTRGYAGHAFAINETLYLFDQLQEKSESYEKDQIIFNYSKSFRYGLRFFEEKGMSYADLVKAMREKKGISNLLNKNLDSNDDTDMIGALYTAQALGSLINYQKTDMTLVSIAPMVKDIFDFVCEKKPDIEFGVCNLFFGAYESGRPKMMGGNPALGKKYFLDMIQKYPHNWLARVAYIQYYLIPQYDEEGYKEQREFFEKALVMNREQLRWSPNQGDFGDTFKEPKIRLFQTVAIERYKIIKKFEKDLF